MLVVSHEGNQPAACTDGTHPTSKSIAGADVEKEKKKKRSNDTQACTCHPANWRENPMWGQRLVARLQGKQRKKNQHQTLRCTEGRPRRQDSWINGSTMMESQTACSAMVSAMVAVAVTGVVCMAIDDHNRLHETPQQHCPHAAKRCTFPKKAQHGCLQNEYITLTECSWQIVNWMNHRKVSVGETNNTVHAQQKGVRSKATESRGCLHHA